MSLTLPANVEKILIERGYTSFTVREDAGLVILNGQPMPTQEELDAWAAEHASAAHNAAIDAEIDRREREAMLPRVTREYMLGMFEATAASQGITPEQLYTANIGYRKVRDFDAAIRALRDQRT